MCAISPLSCLFPEVRISPPTDGVGRHPNVDKPKIPKIIGAPLEPRILSPLMRETLQFCLTSQPLNQSNKIREGVTHVKGNW